MKKAILWTSLAIVVAIVAQPAMAICDADAGFTQTPKGGSFSYNYLIFPGGTSADTDGSQIVGHFWEVGNRAGANEGTTPTLDWVNVFAGAWYIDGNWASFPDSVGCGSGAEAAFVVQDILSDGSGAFFAAGSADSFVSCPREWDMSPDANSNCAARPARSWGNWNLQPIPRPRATGSSRVGTDVVLDLQFDDVAVAFNDGGRGRSPYGVVTGHNIYTQTLPKTSPAPSASVADGWTFNQTVATISGGATVTGLAVNCADPSTFVYVAAGLQFDGLLNSTYTSQPTIVECDPTLADPDRFKLIDRDDRIKGKGNKNR